MGSYSFDCLRQTQKGNKREKSLAAGFLCIILRKGLKIKNKKPLPKRWRVSQYQTECSQPGGENTHTKKSHGQIRKKKDE